LKIKKLAIFGAAGIALLIFLCILKGLIVQRKLKSDKRNNFEEERMKLPIIFSKHYDIKFGGLEKLHPFDAAKYGKIYKYLVKETGIAECYTPDIVTEDDLLSVHTKKYLASLNKSLTIARIAEFPMLTVIPNDILQNRLLKSVRYATGGTILGAELALENGWAINLSGGYHHAKADAGGGFCFLADIPIAVYKLFKKNPELSVMIIDLDAHQGNGYASIFKNDKRIHILDVYNGQIYPNDFEAKKYIEFDYALKSYIEDEGYLSLIERAVPDAIEKSKPGIIIYIAGTDIFEGDLLGCMKISEEGIIKRDELVFINAIKNEIPILMVLGGGYSKESAAITAKSIENILKNVIQIAATSSP